MMTDKMFIKNSSHLQQDLFGFEFLLSESKRKKLQESEEACFYNLIFSKINEDDFSVLYSEKGSRPNAPVNTLVSSIILQDKKGWTVAELFDRIDFDLLTRFALGLNTLEGTPFSEATFFNFKNRLLEYYIATGTNLIERIFDVLTKEQLKALKIKTTIQRTDSFQAMSNIRSYSRIQLLVEVLIRVYRILSDEDKEKWHEILTPFICKPSHKFVFGLKKADYPHTLSSLAEVYHTLYKTLQVDYRDFETFAIFERAYHEHFCVVDERIEVRDSKELSSSCMQSPDDLDATYRKKMVRNSREA